MPRSYAVTTTSVPFSIAVPSALVAPHAGYVYSGPVAASAFARIPPVGAGIDRVVLFGPAHRAFVNGLALTLRSTWPMTALESISNSRRTTAWTARESCMPRTARGSRGGSP